MHPIKLFATLALALGACSSSRHAAPAEPVDGALAFLSDAQPAAPGPVPRGLFKTAVPATLEPAEAGRDAGAALAQPTADAAIRDAAMLEPDADADDGGPSVAPDAGQPKPCPAPQLMCATGCTDVRSSAANCGRCGAVCPGKGAVCVNFACSVP